VVARLKEIDALVSDQVDQPMLLRHSPRPASSKVELERLRFPDAVERIPKNGFYEFQDSQSRVTVRSNPVAQIVSELGMENRKACFGRSPGLNRLQVPDRVEALPAR